MLEIIAKVKKIGAISLRDRTQIIELKNVMLVRGDLHEGDRMRRILFLCGEEEKRVLAALRSMREEKTQEKT